MSEHNAEKDAPWLMTPEERARLVPHVAGCDDEGCYCPDDVVWRRMLGDADPCAPGKDWAAAAFGSLDDECSHGEREGECASCAACAACRGECDTCPYVIPPAEPATNGEPR